jgi:hypothetical protein
MRQSLGVCLVGALLLTLSSFAANAVPLSRTWVSGVGNDANPCSRTAPCETFAGALAKTAAGGEIDVLDPGDFGPVAITQSISIYNDGVGEAGVLTPVFGSNAITIAAGTSGVVNLRGLVLDGQNFDNSGISIQSALRVTIQNCVIQQFYNSGIYAQPSNSMTLKIQDTTIINNAGGGGVYLEPQGGSTTIYASIDRSRIDNNLGNGVIASGFNGGAVLLGLSDSSASLNADNGVILQTFGLGNMKVNALRDVFNTNGGIGVKSDQTGGANATALVGSSMFADDQGGAVGSVNGGSVLTVGNNQISGPPGAFTGTYTLF